MLFNSFDFAIFLPIIFALHWLLARKSVFLQNVLLVSSSFWFYSCWDYRFTFLLLFSILLDYVSGIMINRTTETPKKLIWLSLSIGINLGFLGVFKYYNFFIDSLAQVLVLAGMKINYASLEVILPVGISFYTFHGLSYVIDIYYDRIRPERNFLTYALFVSFFPLLVAGPIERATHLLPQIKKLRQFDYHMAVIGLRQILWGVFKKVVIADNCATYANIIFNNSDQYSGITLMAGAIFFAIQIYGDFSGYSDIALGSARLFGIELLQNFSYPYFSRDIAEFWRRWHISLSSWFRDYLYIPLGGSKGGTGIQIRNTFIIFLVSGLWHGANWNFIFWGLINAIYFLPLLLLKQNRSNLDVVARGKLFPSVKEFFQMIFTFLLTCVAWIFFRTSNLEHAFSFLFDLLSGLTEKSGYITLLELLRWKVGIALPLLILFLFIIEWFGREKSFALHTLLPPKSFWLRWGLYYLIIVFICYFAGTDQQFIYFQF